MMMQVYAVYDAAVKAFNAPFYFRSRGEAIRSFTEAVSDEKSNFFKYASDYNMFYLGEWNDADGCFVCPVAPERVISAQEVLPLGPEFPPGRKQ